MLYEQIIMQIWKFANKEVFVIYLFFAIQHHKNQNSKTALLKI